MKEKEQHVTEDTGRCLDVTPSAAARHLAPYRVSRSGQDGRPRTYCHRDYFAVYYVERGYVTLTADGADLRLAYGDIAIVPPRLPHTLTLCTDKTDIYECSFTIGLIDTLGHDSGVEDDGENLITQLVNRLSVGQGKFGCVNGFQCGAEELG